MGFWNDGFAGERTSTHSHSQSHARSRSRSNSPSRKSFIRTTSHTSSHGGGNNKHYSSRPSLARSASSFFSMGGTPRGRSYSSSSRAKPRSGFVARVRRFLRKVYEYMKRHPVKTFMLVIMPLITGGALTKLLSTVGVRMPSGLQSMVGSSMGRGVSQSERLYARGGARDFAGGSALPGMGGGVGETIQGALSIAKMFM